VRVRKVPKSYYRAESESTNLSDVEPPVGGDRGEPNYTTSDPIYGMIAALFVGILTFKFQIAGEGIQFHIAGEGIQFQIAGEGIQFQTAGEGTRLRTAGDGIRLRTAVEGSAWLSLRTTQHLTTNCQRGHIAGEGTQLWTAGDGIQLQAAGEVTGLRTAGEGSTWVSEMTPQFLITGCQRGQSRVQLQSQAVGEDSVAFTYRLPRQTEPRSTSCCWGGQCCGRFKPSAKFSRTVHYLIAPLFVAAIAPLLVAVQMTSSWPGRPPGVTAIRDIVLLLPIRYQDGSATRQLQMDGSRVDDELEQVHSSGQFIEVNEQGIRSFKMHFFATKMKRGHPARLIERIDTSASAEKKVIAPHSEREPVMKTPNKHSSAFAASGSRFLCPGSVYFSESHRRSPQPKRVASTSGASSAARNSQPPNVAKSKGAGTFDKECLMGDAAGSEEAVGSEDLVRKMEEALHAAEARAAEAEQELLHAEQDAKKVRDPATDVANELEELEARRAQASFRAVTAEQEWMRLVAAQRRHKRTLEEQQRTLELRLTDYGADLPFEGGAETGAAKAEATRTRAAGASSKAASSVARGATG